MNMMGISTRTCMSALLLGLLSSTCVVIVSAGHPFRQFDTPAFTYYFNSLTADSYAQVDDVDSLLPASCRYGPGYNNKIASEGNGTVVTVTSSSGSEVSAAAVQAQCGGTNLDIVCVIPAGLTLVMDAPLVVYALVVRGTLWWTDSTIASDQPSQWLCAGYIAVEDSGQFIMTVTSASTTNWIYLSNNGAKHAQLGTRVFGAYGNREPTIQIKGRNLMRTWSLLSVPLVEGEMMLRLVHDPVEMGWQIGDRIAVAPTDDRSEGDAQSFTIVGFERGRGILLDKMSTRFHDATVIQGTTASKRAEVINLSRNIIITGDDFEEVPCDPTLTEAYEGFGTSTEGCMCLPTRETCTMGLHTIHMYGGVSKIENVRVEKCGQRGIEGKYCLHMHHMAECPDCLFRNNAVEFSVQRGLVVHSTHRSVSDNNVFYDVRGASIYVEDGNEMENVISNNVGICPWHFEGGGCTVPGTSNDQGDTSLNQAGLYLESPNNDLIGNRMANHFNGLLVNAGNGRGPVENLVCAQQAPIGRWENNVFHSSGRFGTYTLHNNYPVKDTGMSIASNGQTGSSDCEAFTSDGSDNGLVVTISNNMDYGNAFVGHYEAGDIQYNGHTSFGNLNNIYWKETKSFADGCSSHIVNSYFLEGTMALPDSLGSFIIEYTTLEDVMMEANHHCGEGGTGFLCMPHYMLHQVNWVDTGRLRWVSFTEQNQAYRGAIFSLSPEDALLNAAGTGGFFLPQSYQSLVSSEFFYLQGTGKCDSSDSLGLGSRYEQGILCKVPLRAMKIYSQNGGGELLLQVWNATQTGGSPISEQRIPFYGINGWKQGYKFPVIPGSEFFYKLSMNGGDIPADWIIDFGDRTITNRWGVDELQIEIQGRECNVYIRSDHDRQFIAADIDKMVREGLGWGRGACTSFPPMPLTSCPDERPPALMVPQFTVEPTIAPSSSSPSVTPSLRPRFTPTESPSLASDRYPSTAPSTALSESEGFVGKPIETLPATPLATTVEKSDEIPEEMSSQSSLAAVPAEHQTQAALRSSATRPVLGALCPLLCLAYAVTVFIC